MSPFGQYLGPERRGEELTPEELEAAERMHHLRNRLGWFLLSAVTVLAVLSVVNTFVAANRSKTQDEANRLIQVTACVENGNKLREGLTIYFDKQISKTKRTNPALFPDIPPAKFRRLVKRQVRFLRRIETRHFALIDCLEIYPALDGQTYPESLVKQASRQSP